MKLSVIIPTYNRALILKKNIDRLFRQKYNDLEIVVVDDGSNKENLKIMQSIKNIVLIKSNHQGPAAARNIAIRHACGDVLVFINDDTRIIKNFLMIHGKFHKTHKSVNAAVFGPLLERKKLINNAAIKWLVFQSGLHFNYEKACGNIVPWYYFWTCNVSIKRIFLIKNGLFFDESFPTAAWEDIEFAYRMKNKGLLLYFDNKLQSFHDHYFGFTEVFDRFYSHGRGLFYLKQKIPKNLLPPLGKSYFRDFFKFIMSFTFYKVWGNYVVRFLIHKDIAPNWLMQILVVAKKIEGYEYEKKKFIENKAVSPINTT